MTDLVLYNSQDLIVTCGDNIIKVIKDSDHCYYGYDLLTEEFKKVLKSKTTPLSNTTIKLLGSEMLRAKLALNLTNTVAKAAKMLNLSERTLFRIKEDYFDVKEEK